MADLTVPQSEFHIDTLDLIKRLKPSLTSFFSVYINKSINGISGADVNFLAYEAVLPGTSFELGQVFGDMQGFTEQYPTKRVYPPIDISFYVNVDNKKTPYPVISYFEGWMQQIFEIKDGGGNNRYGRFNYPKPSKRDDGTEIPGYECDVIITKFERDYRKTIASKLNSKGSAGEINVDRKFTYTLKNAYPSNIISLPVSYSQSDILRTTITFNYDYYSFKAT
jgi:hypothetical protein